MALFVGPDWEVYVCIKLASGVNENEQHIKDETYNENDYLEDALIGGQGEVRNNDDAIHDSLIAVTTCIDFFLLIKLIMLQI